MPLTLNTSASFALTSSTASGDDWGRAYQTKTTINKDGTTRTKRTQRLGEPIIEETRRWDGKGRRVLEDGSIYEKNGKGKGWVQVQGPTVKPIQNTNKGGSRRKGTILGITCEPSKNVVGNGNGLGNNLGKGGVGKGTENWLNGIMARVANDALESRGKGRIVQEVESDEEESEEDSEEDSEEEYTESEEYTSGEYTSSEGEDEEEEEEEDEEVEENSKSKKSDTTTKSKSKVGTPKQQTPKKEVGKKQKPTKKQLVQEESSSEEESDDDEDDDGYVIEEITSSDARESSSEEEEEEEEEEEDDDDDDEEEEEEEAKKPEPKKPAENKTAEKPKGMPKGKFSKKSVAIP
ncbi:uncharacterized protein EAF01_002735 [Botrytis porri]|uniref:uncharacterized protein n=1 Tax=Botrytis porri TaxID=87229 RepID=UPI00190058D8|nr:uncharacterized protein EAF01_002735 [Botrytis porri]KAF7911227.1 hypothetical protein EAF01_002735 [Botrytis porri]